MSTLTQTVHKTVDDFEETIEPWQSTMVSFTSAVSKTVAPYANAFMSLPVMRVMPEPREYIEATWAGFERVLNGRIAFTGRLVAAVTAPLGHGSHVKVTKAA